MPHAFSVLDAFRCTRALAWCLATLLSLPAVAATLSEKARESGCVNKPVVVEGSTYKCPRSTALCRLIRFQL